MTGTITDREVPEDSLLARCASAVPGSYADCFVVEVPGRVDLAAFVTAFYTSGLFRAERLVLRLTGARSCDADVHALAEGRADRFAVWTVEVRTEDEILLRDAGGRTRSWFRVAPGDDGTCLAFGSAVIAVPGRGGKPTLGPVFASLMTAHRLYSRALLARAAARLRRQIGRG